MRIFDEIKNAELEKFTTVEIAGLSPTMSKSVYDTDEGKIQIGNGSTFYEADIFGDDIIELTSDPQTIGDIGDSEQTHSGNIFALNEFISGRDIAVYRMDNDDITADLTGNYTLTNSGTSSSNGIFGADGKQNSLAFTKSPIKYLYNGTLLDTAPTHGLVIDFWIKFDNKNFSYGVFKKHNTGGNESIVCSYSNTTLKVVFKQGAQTKTLSSVFYNGSQPAEPTPWTYVCIVWGLDGRVALNVYSTDYNSSTTDDVGGYMADGNYGHFYIGTDDIVGLDGDICQFRVRDISYDEARIDSLAGIYRYGLGVKYTIASQSDADLYTSKFFIVNTAGTREVRFRELDRTSTGFSREGVLYQNLINYYTIKRPKINTTDVIRGIVKTK